MINSNINIGICVYNNHKMFDPDDIISLGQCAER